MANIFTLALSPNGILLGDFNIHMDNINHPLNRDLLFFASRQFGILHHVNFPTHIKGHTGLNLLFWPDTLQLFCY